MKKNISVAFIVWLLSMPLLFAQTTAIPDINFEIYLETHDIDGVKVLLGAPNSLGDGQINKEVFSSRILDVKTLIINGLDINDLSGLQDFVNLETLNFSNNRVGGTLTIQNAFLKNLLCSSNLLTGLDISVCSSLTILDCSSNQLNALNVRPNSLLETLIGADNQLSSIDLTYNLKLVSLGVSNNQLKNLIVGNNNELKYLSCASNQLIKLDISNTIFLESLDFSKNRIPNSGLIGLNSCTEITSLNISANKFDSIDFSSLIKLKSFNCDSNRFTKLDLSSYIDLNIISCAANQLRTLNIKNGKNASLKILNALYNPKLYCIQVDDVFVTNGEVNGWQKDKLAGYTSATCENLTYVPDAIFEAYLEANDMGDGEPDNNFVLTANVESVVSINVSGKSIADLSGIEDFVALENLNCSYNLLVNLDVSKNRALKTLNCSNNQLTRTNDLKDASNNYLSTSLNLESNTALTTLDCSNNKLKDLKLGKTSVLTTLNCSTNELTSLDVSKNTALTTIDCYDNTLLSNLILGSTTALKTLNCYNNALTSLNLVGTTALTTLNCYDNALISLNLGSTTALTTLNCYKNQLTSLNVSNNLALTTINCNDNKLTSINLGANSVLTTLNCSNNLLENIDLTKNIALTSINCSSNKVLTSLNLTNNTALTTVYCSDNALTSLDLSPNTLLNTLNCANNSLVKLNVKNGKNTILLSFDATLNPKLSCIDVDDDTWSNTNWTNIDVASSFSLNCNTTYIPDANFEAYLESHDKDGAVKTPANTATWVSMGDGISNNNFVATNKIVNVTTLDVSGLMITDLAGIEAFVALLDLNCSSNLLDKLDLTSNTDLKTLDCSTNSLVSLDVRKNSVITSFNATTNPSLSCINVKLSTDRTGWLKDATASYNEFCNTTYVPDDAFEAYLEANGMGDGVLNNNFVLTDKISSVTSLNINTKSIADLTGIADFSSLQNLNCSTNSLVFIDLSSNTALTTLNCSSNQINSLNISGNSALITIDCSNNKLTNLDFTSAINLTSLICNNNALTSLNIKNGVNGDLEFFNSTSNPALYCIEVDNAFAPDGALLGWQKGTFTSYSAIDCVSRQTSVPDDAFEQALIVLGYDAGPLDNLVTTSNIEAVASLDLSGKNIFNLIGIEDFKSLTELNCSSNYLASLNVQRNTALTTLNCGGNNLSTLNLLQNVNLVELLCDANNLRMPLDLSKNVVLERLNCNSNNLTSLDVSDNNSLKQLSSARNKLSSLTGLDYKGYLTDLDCSNNYLEDVSISGNTQLVTLNCSSNLLTGLTTTDNVNLKALNCDVNKIDNLDLSTNNLLKELNGVSNKLKSLTLASNTDLETLNISKNEISTISLSTNINLISLNISKNGLSNLSLNGNNLLENINLSTNSLVSLNLSGSHPNLTILICNENKLDAIDFTNNTAIKELNISSNQFSIIDLKSLDKLQRLNANSNQLTDLDLNLNLALTNVNVSENKLFSLKISNSNNSGLLEFNTLDNPDLRCIEVDVAFASVGKPSWTKDGIASYSENCRYNITDVPDDAFEEYLEVNGMGDGTLGNKIVSTDRIRNVVTLDVSGLGISDLTGIEDFTDLQNFKCSENSITVLDLERNTKLATLNSSNNSLLTSFKLESNVNLITLICTGNPLLTRFDLSKNVLLTTLDCYNNALASLDVSSNRLLTTLNCSMNPIANLNTSSNTDLTTLTCNNNSLTELNLTNNTTIEVLDMSSNQLSIIDLAKLINLKDLNGSANTITNLNLSLNTLLTNVNFDSNELITLNIKNGFNATVTSFNALNNLNLTCIEVDNPAFEAVGWQKESDSKYLVECHYGQFAVPDPAFEQTLIYLGFDSAPLDGYVPNGSVNTETSLIVNSKGITDLTGIEQFTSLVSLDIRNNNLDTLNLSKNLLLETLKCSGNQLVGIDVSVNTELRVLNISNNILETLDVSANSNLIELNCSYNKLSTRELTPGKLTPGLVINSTLEILDCSRNFLTNLSLSTTTNLISFKCSFNQLDYLDIRNGNNSSLLNFDLQNNPNLWCVLVDNITEARGYVTWLKDPTAIYKLECVDTDDDGVANEDDICPATPFGVPVDLFGCPYFALPASNYTVLLTGETCISSNNGKINIVAEKILNYTATVIGINYTNSFKFTKDVDIFNLRSGAYQLCITIQGKPEYSLCYNITITEPKDLAVTSKVNYSNKKVILDLSGGTNYIIDFNGLQYVSTDKQITLNLSTGDNTINIKTDLECQGKYAESIYLADGLFVYPNPFENFIKVYTGSYDSEKVEINIYSTLGQLMLSKDVFVKEDFTTLDTSNMPAGIYYVSLKAINSSSIFKIVKK